MTDPLQPRQSFAEELLKDYEEFQFSEYNMIKNQCKKAAKRGKAYIELNKLLQPKFKEWFKGERLAVQEWVISEKCPCIYEKDCKHPRYLTILAWEKLPESEYYHYENNKYTKKTD
jgi:hypothetical protein